MSDYIKREDALFIALQQPINSLMIAEIKQLKGIDIIRCRECCYFKSEEEYCTLHEMGMYSDDHCSYGRMHGKKGE